jgi:hypothetical protein
MLTSASMRSQFSTPARSQSIDEWDELGFDSSFADSRDILDGDFYGSSLGTSLPNSLPSMGLGITPPPGFSFAEDFLENKVKAEPGLKVEVKSSGGAAAGADGASSSTGTGGSSGSSAAAAASSSSSSMSRPIGIPGAAATSGASAARGFSALETKDKTGQKQNFVGAYSPESRRKRIEKFLDKRQKRVWRKEVKYDVRKNFADSRLRVKGRFVKKEDEQLLRELLSFT